LKGPWPILLSLDPSINNLGWAQCDLAHGASSPDIYDISRWKSGVIHPQGLEIQHKWEDAYRQLAAELGVESWPTHIVAEQPCWMPSAKGRTAAALDYTIHLAQMVAGVIAWFRIPANNVTLLTPMQWKGSMPKKVTRARLKKAFTDGEFEGLSDDEVDAIGLGLFWLKRWLERRQGPSMEQRQGEYRSDLIRLVQGAREAANGNDAAWRGRISTVLRRRGDIPRGLAREVLRQEFKIGRRQIETILNNAC
jgi:hypothetical protein